MGARSAHPSDLFPQGSVEGGSGGDDLREAGRPREGPAKLRPGPKVRHPVECLRPPLVPADPQPRHCSRIVHEQPDLLLQREPPDQVPHPHVHREVRPAEPQAPRQAVPWVTSKRQAGIGLLQMREQEEEEEEERKY